MVGLGAIAAFAQPRNDWFRFYGGPGFNYFEDVYRTADNGFAMCGRSLRIGINPDSIRGVPNDFWIVKTDNNGAQIWEKTVDILDENTNDIAKSLVETDDGGFVVGGGSGVQNGRTFFTGLLTDTEGEVLWQRRFGNGDQGLCQAVIESKAGTFLFGGYLKRQDMNNEVWGYIALVDANGNVELDRLFRPDTIKNIMAIRERQDGGFYLTGYRSGESDASEFALVKLRANYQTDWVQGYPSESGFSSGSKALQSVAGGYALGGTVARVIEGQLCEYPRIVRVDEDGRLIWDHEYINDDTRETYAMVRMPDNGFTIIGHNLTARPQSPFLIRTNEGGDEQWMRLDEFAGVGWYGSGIVDNDGYVITAGCGTDPETRDFQGILVKILPDRSAPVIVEWRPDSLNITALPFRDVPFFLRAEDLQEDSLSYTWIRNGETAGEGQIFEASFDDYGQFPIVGRVTDGSQSDSIMWTITIRDIFIASHSPDTLSLSFRRGTTQTFSLDSVAVTDGDPVIYQWTLTDLNSFEAEDAGMETGATIDFLRSGNFQLEGLVYRGESSDNVIWTITVRSAILDFTPRSLALSTFRDSTLQFSLLPFNPESDSLRYNWLMDGTMREADTLDNLALTFPETGDHRVAGILLNGSEGDTITWTVTVEEPGEVGKWASGQVEKLELLSAYPNPFNSTTTIRFTIPSSSSSSLTLHDLTGRQVRECVSADVRAGEHTYQLNGEGLSAGIYLVRLEAGGSSMVRKVVLVR